MDDPNAMNNFIDRVDNCYRQLQETTLVKNAESKNATQEDLDEFVRILNSAMADHNNPVELGIDAFFKRFYFPHKHVVKMLQSSKNHNRSMRCCVLLTIGLEIVRDLGIEEGLLAPNEMTYSKAFQFIFG